MMLVVEDEQKVADALREGLEAEKYDVVVERTGEAAFFRVNTETFDAVLLDLGLPGRDGLEIRVLSARAGSNTGAGADRARLAAGPRHRARQRRGRLPRETVRLRRADRPRSCAGPAGTSGGRPRLSAGDLDVDLITRNVTRSGAPHRPDRP